MPCRPRSVDLTNEGKPTNYNMTRKARKVRQYTYAPAAYVSTAASPSSDLLPSHPLRNSKRPDRKRNTGVKPSTLQCLARQQGTKIDQRGEQAEVKNNPDPSKCCQTYPRTYKYFHGITVVYCALHLYLHFNSLRMAAVC